jgi:serine protease Do
MRPLPRVVLAFGGLIAVTTIGSVVYANLTGPGAKPAAAASAGRGAAARPLAAAPRGGGPALGGGFAEIITALRPAVVSIARPSRGTHVSPQSGARFVDPYRDGGVRVGAGVIIDPRGLVLTSLQVVGAETDLLVTLSRPKERTLRAPRVATDPRSDLVLLRLVTTETLPSAPLGDSDGVEIGDLVLAFGSPFGFSDSVTAGIVSSNHRRLAIEGRVFDDLLQTDARLNPGNAGGPLVDIEGRVVGINIGALSMNSTFVGIGFAVASNRARALLAQL